MAEKLDQGLDGGDGHGEVLVFREEAVIGLDEAADVWSAPCTTMHHARTMVVVATHSKTEPSFVLMMGSGFA